MIAHHFAGFIGTFFALHFGYALIALTHFMQLTEVSTIFLNFRAMFPKDKMSTFWPSLLQLLFFITYTLFRIIGFPIALYKCTLALEWTWEKLSYSRKISAIVTYALFFVLWAL